MHQQQNCLNDTWGKKWLYLRKFWMDFLDSLFIIYPRCVSIWQNMSRILTIKSKYILNAQSKAPKYVNGFVAYCRSNHCAFFRLVQPRGWGNFPVCDSGGSPTVKGSLIPGRFARCSSTSLHGNPTADSPGGGRSMLRDGPKTLFFIAMWSIVILFTTPSLSWQKAGSVSELLGNCAK